MTAMCLAPFVVLAFVRVLRTVALCLAPFVGLAFVLVLRTVAR